MSSSASTPTSLRRQPQLYGILIALLLCISSQQVSAQQLLVYGDNALPTCAQSCQLLQQAQTACVPPAAPANGQASYESCFCQSAYLRTLYQSPNGLCDAVCSQSDLQLIQTWYQKNCQDGGAAAAAGAVTTTATTASVTASQSTLANVATAAPSNTGSTGVSDATPVQSSQPRSWWSTHWRWVLMLILIFVGLGLLALIFVLFRRRYLKKRDQITSGFNAGITTHPTPMVSAPGSQGLGGPSPTLEAGSGRATPMAVMPYGHNYLQSEIGVASRGNFAAVRERDLAGGRATPDYVERMRMTRGGPPVTDTRRDREKGKNRVQVEERDGGT